MVDVHVSYLGELRCEARHGPSGATLLTDAPADNHGKGAAFSPTDLVATALASCVLTTMAIVGERRGLDLSGTEVQVRKEMVTAPERRIGRLPVTVTFARAFTPDERTLLERTALHCPVHKSLRAEVEAPVEFVYPDA